MRPRGEGSKLMSSTRPGRLQPPTLPTGTEVAAYKTYQEASAAVDTLSQSDFPLPGVSIVGTDLHMVDKVMGRLTPARVALGGASQGLTWGLLMTFVFMIFSETFTYLIPLFAVGAGVGVGVLMAMFTWMNRRGKRSFASQSQLVATRYAVLVEEETQRAYDLLQQTPGNLNRTPRRRVRRSETVTGPTEYGSRPSEQPKFGVRLEAEDSPNHEPSASEREADANYRPENDREDQPAADEQ